MTTSLSTRHCLPLGAEVSLADVGGKAHTLGRLMRAGVNVPPGFVIGCAAFEEHVTRSGAGLDDGASAKELVVGAPLEEALSDELMELARPLLTRGPVVVRSSAVGEDSATASFAGQLDSILHVASEVALADAVRAVWASYWSDRAIFYRQAKGVAGAGMGVVVQSQVPAQRAGVMFTRWDDGGMLVEYTDGLADQLVSGAVEPTRLRIPGDTADTAFAKALTHAAADVEHVLGEGQDVEWAMTAEGTLFVVQSRPITTAPAARRVTWTNANVAENFPEPISPLLYSVASAGYTNYFRNLGRVFGVASARLDAMEPAFQQIIGVHGARMYYNLTNIHAVIRLAPFGDALARSFDAFVGAAGVSVPASSVSRRGRMRQGVELARIAFNVVRQYAVIERRIRAFEARADGFARMSHPSRLPSATLAELNAMLGEFMDIRCYGWTNASLADTAAMVCHGALQRLIARVYPGESSAHTSLLKAIPNVVSNEPVHRLWELSRLIRADARLAALVEHSEPSVVLDAMPRFPQFQRAFEAYLDEWGFRCSSELMLTVPSFQEDPAPVIDLLRAYARLDADTPRETMARQTAEREAETRRALGAMRLPLSLVFRVLLPWTHASIRYRERARLKQALLYSRLRRVALAAGDALVRAGVIDDRSHVFWLTMEELRSLMSGSAMFAHDTRALVQLRAGAHAELSATTPPDAFTLAEGAYWSPSASDDIALAEVRESYQGASACAGRVTGRAAVLRDVSEAERLGKGDVLVTRQTDPGWGPVFFLIAGLVIERGGMLSHGAILAREFGIPCLVGIRDATRLIPDGATITVDGDGGCVHVAR